MMIFLNVNILCDHNACHFDRKKIKTRPFKFLLKQRHLSVQLYNKISTLLPFEFLSLYNSVILTLQMKTRGAVIATPGIRQQFPYDAIV